MEFLPTNVESDSDSEEIETQQIKQPDKYKTLYETFDQHKLSHIINNEATYRPLMRPEVTQDEDYNPFTIMKKYLAKSRGGKITVEYRQNEGKGRFYALGGLSLQSLPREIRHSIAKGYTDIDMVNAHPVILSHLCGDRSVVGSKITTKYLDRYNNSRDELLKTLGVSREIGKTAILSLINGGSKAYDDLPIKPRWLLKLKREIDKIHKHFSLEDGFEPHRVNREKKGITYNHAASYMNVQLCDYENVILQRIWTELGEPDDCVLCFDGIMVRTSFDLQSLEKAALTAGIKINLKVKDMDEGFVFGEGFVFPQYIDPEYNRFDFEDSYTYQMFHSEFNGKRFRSYVEMEEEVWDKSRKVIALILDGEGSFIKKDKDGKLSTVKKLGRSNFNMFYDKIRISIEDFLGAHDAFGNYVCKMDRCSETDFNLWTGFRAKRRAAMDPRTQLMIDFVKDIWAGGNQEVYDYLISWFAGLLTPGMNRTAIAMVAPQGTGKGFFLEFMKLILRRSNVADMIGIQSITQKHNTAIQGKRVVVINEMSSTRDEFKSNFDKIKSYITDPVITIEPKGVNPYSIDNIGNYMLFTNHRDAIIVEESDRRYAIFEMSTARMNDTEYFNMLERECFNQEVADSFYSYLLDYPAVDVRKIPDTALRREMMSLSKSTPLKFLDYSLGEGKEDIWDSETTIGATVFYQKYVDWCRENGERNCYSHTKFGLAIKGKIQKRKTRSMNVYVLPAHVEGWVEG